MMCGEMQFEGAFDESNARVSCSESSTSTEKVTSGVIWARATIALPANKFSAFSEYGFCNFSIWPFSESKKKMVIVMKISYFQFMVIVKKIFYLSVSGYCKSLASCGIAK